MTKNKLKKHHKKRKYAAKKTTVTHKNLNGILNFINGGTLLENEKNISVFIPERNRNSALNGDTVSVFVFNKTKRVNGTQYFQGEVVAVLQRCKTRFIGVLEVQKTCAFLEVVAPKIHTDFYIALDHLKNAQHQDKVVVELNPWKTAQKNPTAKVVEVLGKQGMHETEIQHILHTYDLPLAFPKNVFEAAEKIPDKISKKAIKQRLDMRNVLTFTIDPKNAKDFDDALSFRELPSGNFEVSVHIADVTHYVKSGTPLDDEAYHRATSVYLVDRVVPMLPRRLSNGLCSLKPEEEKLTFSVIFEMDENANILAHRFAKTVIFSDTRFSYEEAQYIIEQKKKGAVTIPPKIALKNEGKAKLVGENFCTAIKILDALAKKIRVKRFENGAIAFDKTEIKFNLNKEKKPTGVYFKTSQDANKLIEEFMLLANKYVARFVGANKDKKVKTFVYRIHDEPDPDKIADLKQLVKKLGYQLDTRNKEVLQEELNTLLKNIADSPEKNMIETLVIRCMSKAIYSTENIGHYGLAFAHYTHFTSPIRRYPDMMVHRLLTHYLEGGQSLSADAFEDACQHCSQREIRAIKAERDSIKYMQIKYMQQFPSEIFEGVITGIIEWGIFVEVTANKCEGLVMIRDLKDDRYFFDEKAYAMVGRANRKKYTLGDIVFVKLKKADPLKKHLDFYLVENEAN